MIRSKVKLTIQNTPLHNYRENGCKCSALGSLGSFGLTTICRQYSNAANNQSSFVYVFSIHLIPEIFEPNVPYLFALILYFIYSRQYGHVVILGRSDFWSRLHGWIRVSHYCIQGRPSTDHK